MCKIVRYIIWIMFVTKEFLEYLFRGWMDLEGLIGSFPIILECTNVVACCILVSCNQTFQITLEPPL